MKFDFDGQCANSVDFRVAEAVVRPILLERLLHIG